MSCNILILQEITKQIDVKSMAKNTHFIMKIQCMGGVKATPLCVRARKYVLIKLFVYVPYDCDLEFLLL